MVSKGIYDQYKVQHNESLGQQWVMATRHCWRADIGPILDQHLSFKSWTTVVGPMLELQLRTNCGFWVMGQTSRVIFLNIKFILIMQKLYNLLLSENSVILFYNNNFMIYLVIISDFVNLKLDKILFIYLLFFI